MRSTVKTGKLLLLVVVAGVVAEGSFQRDFAGLDGALEHDLGAGRHLQLGADALDQLGARAAQQARELILGQRIGHRRDRAEDGRRVGTERDGNREPLARLRQAVVAEIERAATLRQPAHDDLVARDHLLAIDAQVLTRLVRAARHRQAPGDERARIARPAGLDRQAAEIDLRALPDDLLAGRAGALLRRHVQHLLEHRQLVPGILQPAGRIGFLQVGQQLAHFAQRFDRLLAHPHRHAPGRTEQIAQNRNAVPLGLLEQQRRAAGLEHPIADLGHLQPRGDLDRDALELALLFELREEIAQIVIAHAADSEHGARPAVHRHDRAGDVAGLGGGQKQRQVGDVLRGRVAAQRHFGLSLREHLVFARATGSWPPASALLSRARSWSRRD